MLDTDPNNNARAAVKVVGVLIAAGSLGPSAMAGPAGIIIAAAGFALAWGVFAVADHLWPKPPEPGEGGNVTSPDDEQPK